MPRYFFHISNKSILMQDCEGVDLPDIRAAVDETTRACRNLGVGPSDACGLEFIVADSSGHMLFKVPVPEQPKAQGSHSLSIH